MSSRSSGRHRKSRMSSRRTLTVVTGAAGVVVAVTTGAVPVTLVPPDRPATPAPGQGRSSDPRPAPRRVTRADRAVAALVGDVKLSGASHPAAAALTSRP